MFSKKEFAKLLVILNLLQGQISHAQLSWAWKKLYNLGASPVGNAMPKLKFLFF